MIALVPADAATKPKPQKQVSKQATGSHTASARNKKIKTSKAKRKGARAVAEREEKPAPPPLPGELGVLQQAIGLVRQSKLTEAAPLTQSLSDPAAQKLVEWTLLRNGDTQARFDRYQAFIRANPGWPAIVLRRRAEARLWQERRDAATVRGFLTGQPTTSKGRLALARAMLTEGDRAGAEREVRATWRSDELSAELETAVLEAFPGVLTQADHTARMHRRVGAKDFGGAMRAARRLGDDAILIVKACANADDDRKALEAVPTHARGDLGYVLCRAHYLLRHDGFATAAQLILGASPEDLKYQDTNEWWRERRTLARKLLDLGEPATAYKVVSSAATPANPYYRAEFHFMSGWIALRFLADPAKAIEHFARVDEDSADPIVLARAAYWRGRAYEVAGQANEMRAQYEAAARHPTAYYGQLARGRLGLGELELRPMPGPVSDRSAEVLRAAELLYAIGERELVLSFVTDLAAQSTDAAELAALAEISVRASDARATLLIGKTALTRGLPLDISAFPNIGVPNYTPIGPALDRSVVFSIARTESEFNQRDVSPAKAVGIMQVTPEAGRDTAKRFGVSYDWDRLVKDAVYNTQMGAAELAALLKEYRGNYIMSFAGYNAGRGRVQQWVAQFGDPRDPKVDAIDWVERIPFAETRNYVQRVMENLHVYRVRFGAGATAKADPNTPGVMVPASVRIEAIAR